jgi:hypothetical protein
MFQNSPSILIRLAAVIAVAGATFCAISWLSPTDTSHSLLAEGTFSKAKSSRGTQLSHPGAGEQLHNQPTEVTTPHFNSEWESKRDFQSAPVLQSGEMELTPEVREVFAALPPMCSTDLPVILKPSTGSKPATTPTESASHRQSEPRGPQSSAVANQNFGLTDQAIAQAAQQVASQLQTQADFQQSIAKESRGRVASANWDASVDRQHESDAVQAASFSAASPHAFNPHSAAKTNPPSDPTLATKAGEDPHAAIYSRSAFPSARQCAQCHKQLYEEWASSSHAYASISPMFHVFEETINKLSQGTIGYFCYRCHSPVSTTMGLRRDQPIWDGPRVFREGVTCVACHRVKTPYGKADGERRIEPGDIYEPVYGAGDGRGVSIADKYKQFFKVNTNRPANEKAKTPGRANAPGQAMHRGAIQFEELSESTFCMSCHQVAVEPGIKLEVVWDQYRASPAYRNGVKCQDCHMGKVPGVDEGYSVGPGAVVNNKVINAEKKHSNHVFYGPGYSIAHPGIFPDNVDADRWSVPQWLEFDWRAGWGTDEFEDALDDGKIQWTFPEVWAEADDRYDAREVVDANLKKLEYKRDLRRQLLENGSKLDGPFFLNDPAVGQPLNMRFCLTNLNSGHNMPSGSLGAQPQLWMNLVVIDPTGKRIWETGYLDSHGDMADNHSLDVLARKIPLDTQLVNLQTKFLTTNAKGTDREMYLPVNFDFDQLPFLRPPQQPVSVQNHPPFIRMEGHSIPPLGKRNAKFVVPGRLMTMPGTYRVSVRMRSRAEPIYFMRFCNATEEMKRMMNEWICDFHINTVMFEVR